MCVVPGRVVLALGQESVCDKLTLRRAREYVKRHFVAFSYSRRCVPRWVTTGCLEYYVVASLV